MFDLTFLTSNKVKVSHARHICRFFDVDIHQKKYYGVEYIEPRILHDRDKLLQQSFNDAVKRWKKNGKSRKYFFFEDTSVRIEAISGIDDEPGIDIKYWMQGHTFEDIDKLLKEKGNNRKATVYSHIVLYIPNDDDTHEGYEQKIFQSCIEGRITDTERKIDTQILYPWLDNKSFNKWFIPDGFTVPVSLLSIQEADSVDFRKGALEEMMHFLGIGRKKDEITDKIRQLRIPFYSNFLICGPTCSGKTTFGRYLADNYGYYHVEASQFMTMKYWETHGINSSIDKHDFACKVLNATPFFVADKTIDFIEGKGFARGFVITGFRSPDEVKRFCNFSSLTDIHVIYIDSQFDIRYKRWKSRNRDDETYTRDRFARINSIQNSMGVCDIKNLDDAELLINDSESLDVFYKDINKELLNGELAESKIIDESITLQNNVTLEECILYTLGVEYIKDTNKYFTTTEIAHLINETFKSLSSPKNKNNVSRYFNQTYYPYYEIRSEKGTSRFRLSPIGYSEFKSLF